MFEGIWRCVRRITGFPVSSTPVSNANPSCLQPVSPPDVDVPTKTKRQIQFENCELARKCKAEKQAKAAAQTDLETLFWDDFDQSEDMKNCKENIALTAMKRLDDGWTYVDVGDVAKLSFRTLKRYQEVWKTEERNEDRFKYHVINMKKGRKLFPPLVALDVKALNRSIVRNEDCQKIGSKRTAFQTCILPVMKKHCDSMNKNSLAIKMPSKSSIYRNIDAFLPVQPSNKAVKKSIKSRLAARKSPFGAMSFVAMFPQLIDGISLQNLYFMDSVPVELFGSTCRQKKIYLTDESAQELKDRRAAPKAKDAGGQRRAFKVHITMAPGPGGESLVCGVGMIFDHCIKQIQIIPTSTNVFIMFCPYCEADEVLPLDSETNESLDARFNYDLYDKCAIPKILQRMERLMQWARENGHDPSIFSSSRIFQDGEGGPLHNIINTFANLYRLLKLYFAKLPNALTAEVQIGDRSGAHPGVHRGFNSDEFVNMTEDAVAEIARMLPGVQAALDFLKISGISAAGQMTYRRAIAFLPQLLERCVTPSIVTDALQNSGYHPFKPDVMFKNMWDGFADLSTVEAQEVIRISETSVRELTNLNGIVYPLQCQEALEASELLNETIDFPEVRQNFEDLAWNRQLSIDLSHSHVARLVEERSQSVAIAAQVRMEEEVAKAEQTRRDNLRYDHCVSGETMNAEKRTIQHSCKCGGKFFNGLSGFKSHEKSQTHQGHFPPADWDTFYAANLPPQRAAVLPAPAPVAQYEPMQLLPALAPVAQYEPMQLPTLEDLQQMTSVATPPDGSCLFHALLAALEDLEGRLGYQIENLPRNHADMRRRIVQYERDHLDDDTVFREVASSVGHISAVSARQHIRNNGLTNPADRYWCRLPDAYFAEMSKDDTWGEDLEIMAACAAFNVNISVHVGPRVGLLGEVQQGQVAKHFLCGTENGEFDIVVGRIALHNYNGKTHYEWKRPVAIVPVAVDTVPIPRAAARRRTTAIIQRGVVIDGVYHPPAGFIT
jgi:hypothetical protein